MEQKHNLKTELKENKSGTRSNSEQTLIKQKPNNETKS